MNLPPDGLRLLRVSIRSKIEVVLTYIILGFGGWDGAVVIILAGIERASKVECSVHVHDDIL
ncbi:hypothetical protein ASPTUDRAFT_44060, partial [Aspergillus tubingensis CBS 134.48]